MGKTLTIRYDALASLGIHSDQQREWLLKLAAAEAGLVHPPLPAPTGSSGFNAAERLTRAGPGSTGL